MNLQRLNDLLAQELGRNPYGSPVFRWEWSDDLFWPAFATGRNTTVKKSITVPIIGGGEEALEVEEVVPEYRRDRQTRQQHKWFVTKWLSPEELICGGIIGHGMGWMQGKKPDRAALIASWERQFPGAEFPARGWRVPTDAWLPRGPHDPATPNLPDTEHFIRCIREQTSMGFDARLEDMLAYEDRKDAAVDKRILDETEDCYPAFLNPFIGKRGSSLSLPFTKFDRGR